MLRLTLFIGNEVFGTCDDASLLDTDSSIGETPSLQVGVGPKAFGVTTTSRNAAKRTADRAQADINPLGLVLLAHGLSTIPP